MAQALVYNMEGKEVGKETLPKGLFDVEMNDKLVADVIVAQNANARAAIAHTKDRSEVRGGGRKPWRQKGTGRARAGSNRSPIWRGGGVTFGPTKERNFAKGVNKKAKRTALAMALSAQANAKAILLVKDMKLDGKTKQAAALLNAIAPEARHKLMVLPGKDEKIARSTKNLSNVELSGANSLNVRDVLKADALIMPVEALKVIEKTYAK